MDGWALFCVFARRLFKLVIRNALGNMMDGAGD